MAKSILYLLGTIDALELCIEKQRQSLRAWTANVREGTSELIHRHHHSDMTGLLKCWNSKLEIVLTVRMGTTFCHQTYQRLAVRQHYTAS